MNTPVDVVAAVICRDSLYLICQRPHEKTHGGLWEFPGGKVQDGETFETALRRELLEELGLAEINIGAELYQGIEDNSPYNIRFIEVTACGEPTLIEHIGAAWIDASKLLTFPLAPVDLRFAQLLTNHCVNESSFTKK